MRDTRRSVWVLSLAAVWAFPAVAAAQDAGREPGGEAGPLTPDWVEVEAKPFTATLELSAYAGALLPMANLGERGDSVQAELSTSPAFAASLEYWFAGGLGLSVMGGLASPDLSLTRADSVTGFPAVTELGSVDYFHGEALLLYRPELDGSAAVVLPYVGAGGGFRSLSFESGSQFDDASGFAFALVAGAHVRLGDHVHMRLDVRDLVSSFDGGPFEESTMQHDLFAQVGLGIGL